VIFFPDGWAEADFWQVPLLHSYPGWHVFPEQHAFPALPQVAAVLLFIAAADGAAAFGRHTPFAVHEVPV